MGAITRFSARDATIRLSSTQITWDLATNLDDETFGITVVSAKDITVALPKAEVEQVPLLGVTAQTIGSGVITTGTFQNMILDEKSYTNGKITGTLVLTGDEQFEQLSLGVGRATTGTNVSTRYGFGDVAAGQDRVRVGSILVTLHNNTTDASGEVASVAMNNCRFMIGEIKPTSAEGGHWEIGFECEALPGDCALEFQD